MPNSAEEKYSRIRTYHFGQHGLTAIASGWCRSLKGGGVFSWYLADLEIVDWLFEKRQ